MHARNRRTALSSLVLAAFTALPAAAAVAPESTERVDASLRAGSLYEPAELLLQFQPGLSAKARQAWLSRHGLRSLDRLRKASAGQGELHRLRLPEELSVEAGLHLLRSAPEVALVEPNFIYTAQAVSNDPYYINGSLWGLYGAGTPHFSNPYGSGAAAAWANEHTCLRKVHVGLLDEGVMFSHKDFGKNIWTHPKDLADGKDEDGNGYVDDTRGWDFVNNDNTVFDDISDDHGTQVAGIIGARGGNEKGVTGVCWNVSMIVAKVLSASNGNASNAIKAIDYMIDLKTRHKLQLVALNASWGSTGYSEALKNAITRAGAAEILLVASAGNASINNDLVPFYPASYALPNVISVASLAANGSLPSFSNWGPTSVHLAAPGTSIYTTTPVFKSGEYGSGYAALSGSSWATAFVTGAIALMATTHQNATAAQLKEAVLEAAIPTPSLTGKVVTGARLDASGF